MNAFRVVACGVLVLAACKKEISKEEVHRRDLAPALATYGATVRAKLAALHAIGKTALAAPPVTAREPLTGPTELEGYNRIEMTDVQWLLDKPDVPNNLPTMRSWNQDQWDAVVAAVSGPPPANIENSQSSWEDWFRRMATIQQVLVVRYRWADSTMPKASDADHFTPGVAIGDAILYDVDSKKRIGAFPFVARQGDRANGDITINFLRDVESAILQELGRYQAGKLGPASVDAPPDPPQAVFQRQAEHVFKDMYGYRGTVTHLDETTCDVLVITGLPDEIAGEQTYAKSGKVAAKFATEITRIAGRPCTTHWEQAK